MRDREDAPKGRQRRQHLPNVQASAATSAASGSEPSAVSDGSRFAPPLWAVLAQPSAARASRSGKGEPVEGVLAGRVGEGTGQPDAHTLTTSTDTDTAAATATAADTASPAVAGKAPASQTVAITTVDGPTDLGYGGYSWKVWYNMAAASGAAGWVIQEVRASLSTSGAASRIAWYHYWEAWEVEKGKKVTVWQDKALDDNDDLYYSSPAAMKTKGENKFVGVVKFYEGALPADFKKNNPNTIAGILHSTTTKPPFWDGTGTAHNITATWDDTGKATKSSVTAVAGATTLKGKPP